MTEYTFIIGISAATLIGAYLLLNWYIEKNKQDVLCDCHIRFGKHAYKTGFNPNDVVSLTAKDKVNLKPTPIYNETHDKIIYYKIDIIRDEAGEKSDGDNKQIYGDEKYGTIYIYADEEGHIPEGTILSQSSKPITEGLDIFLITISWIPTRTYMTYDISQGVVSIRGKFYEFCDPRFEAIEKRNKEELKLKIENDDLRQKNKHLQAYKTMFEKRMREEKKEGVKREVEAQLFNEMRVGGQQ